jgi:hypothetical protein
MPTVSRNIVVTQSNITGFSAVSPDPIAILTEEGFGVLAAATYLPSIYQGATISIDLEFNIEYIGALDIVEGVLPAQNVTSYFNFSNHGLTATYISNNLIRIAGTYVNAFTDEYYNFVLKDMSQAILLPTTDEDFLALIEYNMPNPVTIKNEYLFDAVGRTDFASPTPTSSISGEMFQWIVWNYTPTVSTILSLVDEGI